MLLSQHASYDVDGIEAASPYVVSLLAYTSIDPVVGAEVQARTRLESTTRFQTLIVKSIHSAFNLNPLFCLSLLRRYAAANDFIVKLSVRRCRLTSG